MSLRLCGLGLACVCAVAAPGQKLTLDRGKATVMVEPYASNVVRVTLSLIKEQALAAPGFGIVAKAVPEGWAVARDGEQDVLRSSRMVVTVSPPLRPGGHMPETSNFFSGSTPPVGVSIKTPEGATLLDMHGWQMAEPNHKDGTYGVMYDRRPTDDPFYTVGASFSSPKDEHYYGLGQNQEGYLDRRGHSVRCAHDYNAPAGQSVCVPFVVTNKGYGLL